MREWGSVWEKGEREWEKVCEREWEGKLSIEWERGGRENVLWERMRECEWGVERIIEWEGERNET